MSPGKTAAMEGLIFQKLKKPSKKDFIFPWQNGCNERAYLSKIEKLS